MRPAGALQGAGIPMEPCEPRAYARKRGPATSQQIGRIANWRHGRLNLPACTVCHFEGCDSLSRSGARCINSIKLVVRTSELSPKVAIYIRNLIRQQTPE